MEQITIALIYKFMDDMDSQSEELGGKRKFFTGDFSRYAWAKLMSPALGGFEMLSLYAEGITTMPENIGIPPLFREIFKNAYLPYRDPETLKSFLKIIDEFTYDHSVTESLDSVPHCTRFDPHTPDCICTSKPCKAGSAPCRNDASSCRYTLSSTEGEDPSD